MTEDQIEVYEELAALFDYNPPPIQLLKFSRATFAYPNVFYERHLDSRLALRRVRLLHSLPRDIAQLPRNELKALEDRGQPLPRIGNKTEDGCDFMTEDDRASFLLVAEALDAVSVAGFYGDVSHRNCSHIASTIALHPKSESWNSVLKFCTGNEPETDKQPAMTDTFVLRISDDPVTRKLQVPGSIWARLGHKLRADISKMLDRFETLATMQFHAPLPEVEQLFRDMGGVGKMRQVPSLECPTFGWNDQNNYTSPPIFDSASAIESLPSVAAVTKRRRSTRLRLSNVHATKRSRAVAKGTDENIKASGWPTITIKTQKPSTSSSDAFIWRAWMRCANFDNTLIIFDCGRYERIGFRHRASQTLFLSDLIDACHGSEPKYGQLQTGLYTLILRDTLDRINLMDSSSEYRKATNLKRKAVNDLWQLNPSKKRKTRSTISKPKQDESSRSVVLHEANGRSLALLRIQYNAFNSPAPAALYRIGSAIEPSGPLPTMDLQRKSKYHGREYFRVTLISDIAQGATGKVHDAVIEVLTGDGRIHSVKAVAKVALRQGQRQKLRHEYTVYRYMALKKVKHVATIYGLFEDAADEAMVLVMSNVGTSLVEQPHYMEHGKVKLTAEQQDAFKAAMTEIHQAGVRHYDIRPENLMMDDDGNVTIIDFDMAKVRAGKRSRQREFEHLCDLLTGGYVPPNQWASPPTSAGPPPPDDDILEGRI